MEVTAERSRGRRGGRGRGRGARGPGDRQQRFQEHERGGRGGGGGGGGGGGRAWRGAQGRGPRGTRHPRGRDFPAQQQQQQVEDDVDIKEDYDAPNEFSRRQIVSNWDRYKTEEKEVNDGGESLRGADFNVLLSSAGDSFAQFRFAEEKEWEVEVNTSSKQISPLFVDCQSLAQSLQELPLYLRLNVEAELVQITPPAELPQMRLKSMHDGLSKFSQFRAQAIAPSTDVGTIPVNSVPEDPGKQTFNLMLNPVIQAPECAPPASQQLPDKLDEDLDYLLKLEMPVSKSNDIFLKGAQDVEVLCDPETVNTSTDSYGAEVIDNTSSQPAETAKKLDPEEELEDWLDSMIS